MLKRCTLFSVVWVASLSPCLGDDGSQWTGFYAGLHVGYAQADADVGFQNFGLPGLGTGYSADTNGGIAGAQVGIQRQFESLVVGLEAQFSASSASGGAGYTGDGSGFFCDSDCQADVEFTTEINDIFQLTGRVGWTPRPLWLFYAKGGYASAQIEHRGRVDAQADFCDGSPCTLSGRGNVGERHDGWVLGGGVEHRLTQHITLGLDYSVVSLDDRTASGTSRSTVGDYVQPGTITLDVRPEPLHMLSVRLNYGF